MASISQVRICNMALSHVGARSTIENITEKSVEGRLCNIWYDYSRLETLEVFDWSFARKRQDLGLHGDAAPTDAWDYRYQYPSDCVAIRKLVNPLGSLADAVPYEIEISTDGTKSILTNLESAEGVYTFDQVNTVMYSALFVSLFSHLLASHLAMPITGKRSIEADMLQRAARLTMQAPAQDANESVEAPPRDAPWISGR